MTTEKTEYDPAWLATYLTEPYAHADTRWPSLVTRAGNIDRILDIGGSNGIMAKGYWDGRGVGVHVLDLWKPVTMMPNFNQGNALDALTIFGEKSFDLVQMTEVLEHMDKATGRKMVEEILPALARKMVLVTTPCGYSVQDVEVGGNPHQKHISGWSPAELVSRGYEVLINGPERADHWRPVEQQNDRPQLIGWRML